MNDSFGAWHRGQKVRVLPGYAFELSGQGADWRVNPMDRWETVMLGGGHLGSVVGTRVIDGSVCVVVTAIGGFVAALAHQVRKEGE